MWVGVWGVASDFPSPRERGGKPTDCKKDPAAQYDRVESNMCSFQRRARTRYDYYNVQLQCIQLAKFWTLKSPGI